MAGAPLARLRGGGARPAVGHGARRQVQLHEVRGQGSAPGLGNLDADADPGRLLGHGRLQPVPPQHVAGRGRVKIFSGSSTRTKDHFTTYAQPRKNELLSFLREKIIILQSKT